MPRYICCPIKAHPTNMGDEEGAADKIQGTFAAFGDVSCQDTAHFLRSVELAGFLASTCCKLANLILFIVIAILPTKITDFNEKTQLPKLFHVVFYYILRV